jgi:glycosyltransferase involved in cell wall biosynthesis
MNNLNILDFEIKGNITSRKIMIISADFPHPVDTGKKLVLSGFEKYFIERFGTKNITWLIVGLDNCAADKLTSVYGFKVESVLLPNFIERLFFLIWYSLICRSKSLQESMFYSLATHKKIKNKIKSIKPDIIMYDTIRMGQFFTAYDNKKSILYLEDLFSIRYKRMRDQLIEGRSFGSTVLGNFGRFIPSFFRNQINKSKFIQSALLKYEENLVARSERTQPAQFNASLLLNAEEVEVLRAHTARDTNIQFIPPFLSLSVDHQRNYDGKAKFVYLGALQYPPNEAGLLDFFNQGLDLAIENIPDFELVIVGKGASQRLIEASGRWEGRVKFLGYVEDLSPLYSTCCGVILPIVLGTGVKLKALEAMSRGVPVISTRMGVDSIPVNHDIECYIEDDLSKFWIWMKKITNCEYNKKMSERTRLCFNSFYSRDVVFNVYDKIFYK